jgi:hypothetical protein
VQLKTAKKSRGRIARELEELAAALEAPKVPFTSKYDLEREQFVVTAETQAAADAIRAALPKTRKVETVFRIAPVPKPQAAPTGVQAGDVARGGRPVYAGQSEGGHGGLQVRPDHGDHLRRDHERECLSRRGLRMDRSQ